MEKTRNAVWRRSIQKFWRELCSGPVWWGRRCSFNIDDYLRDGVRNQNRTFVCLQLEGCKNSKVLFWGFIHIIYIYIYLFPFCLHLCIDASIIYLYILSYLVSSIYLSVECIKTEGSKLLVYINIYVHIYTQPIGNNGSISSNNHIHVGGSSRLPILVATFVWYVWALSNTCGVQYVGIW